MTLDDLWAGNAIKAQYQKILLELMTTLDGSHLSSEWSLWDQLSTKKFSLNAWLR